MSLNGTAKLGSDRTAVSLCELLKRSRYVRVHADADLFVTVAVHGETILSDEAVGTFPNSYTYAAAHASASRPRSACSPVSPDRDLLAVGLLVVDATPLPLGFLALLSRP